MANLYFQPWLSTRRFLASWRRQVIGLLKVLRTSRSSLLHFRCNICGRSSSFPQKEFGREVSSCRHCGSTVRWRSVIHALSMQLFGKSLVISDFPSRPDLTGIGLSDWNGYADRLATKLGYTNTFFHQVPLLDITSVSPNQANLYDFIISSDVFEHICQPVSKAFENAYRLLKPGGVMIFTVPYVGGKTREHFPDVCEFSVIQEDKTWIVVGKTVNGEIRNFTDLTFHGGKGTVVECRLFGADSLLENCKLAGFDPIHIHVEPKSEFGIIWNPYVAADAPYRPLIYGLDTPPWSLSKPA